MWLRGRIALKMFSYSSVQLLVTFWEIILPIISSTFGMSWGQTLNLATRFMEPLNRKDLGFWSWVAFEGLEINSFEIATRLAELCNTQHSYLTAPLYAGSRESRDTICQLDVFRDTITKLLLSMPRPWQGGFLRTLHFVMATKGDIEELIDQAVGVSWGMFSTHVGNLLITRLMKRSLEWNHWSKKYQTSDSGGWSAHKIRLSSCFGASLIESWLLMKIPLSAWCRPNGKMQNLNIKFQWVLLSFLESLSLLVPRSQNPRFNGRERFLYACQAFWLWQIDGFETLRGWRTCRLNWFLMVKMWQTLSRVRVALPWSFNPIPFTLTYSWRIWDLTKTWKITKNRNWAESLEAATTLQLENLLERKPRSYLEGSVKELKLDGSLFIKPKVFLLMVPLNLGAALLTKCESNLQIHARLDATMVYVTHDQVEAMTMADRLLFWTRKS